MTSYLEQANFWANRNELIEPYFNKKLINRSKWLANKLKTLDFSSILECGCYNGRNLKVIADEFKHVKIAGLDVNQMALDVASKLLGPDVDLFNVDILGSDDKKYDVVFTHGVLMHIPPDGIEKCVDKIISKANKYILHLERKELNGHVLRGPKSAQPEVVSTEWRWAPNVSDIYKKKGFNVHTETVKIEGSGKPSTFTLIKL